MIPIYRLPIRPRVLSSQEGDSPSDRDHTHLLKKFEGMAFYRKIIDRTLRSAWWRFVRLWQPMALWTLLTWVLMGLVLVPLSSAVLREYAFRGERVIIGNYDLVEWLSIPEVLLYVVIAGTLTVVADVVRFAGLFRMVTDDMNGRSVGVQRTLLELLPDFTALVRLCVAAVVATVLLLAPLAAGIAAIYAVLLGAHDVNYYLAAQPPEWHRALIAAGLWTGLWLIATIYVVLHSLASLPAYLDGHRPAHVALKRSWKLVRGDALRILRIVLVCVGVWLITRAIAHAVLFSAAAAIAGRMVAQVSSVTPMLIVSAGYAGGTLLLDAVLSFVGFSIVATMLTKFYYEDTDLHALVRPDPGGRKLASRRTLASIRTWLHPKRALTALAAAAGITVIVSGYLVSTPPQEPSVVVTAHRAGAYLATENTLAALERSIDAGADYAEIDVQTTRDSVVVVVHDADLMRLASDPRRVADIRYDDLRDIALAGGDAATGADDPEAIRLATLDEFLSRAKGRIGLNIELKYYSANPYLAERVVELVREHEMTAPEDAVVMSQDLAALRQVQRLAPEISTGYLSALSVGNLTRLPVHFLAVAQPVATKRLIRNAHAREMKVHVWTLNRAGKMLEMIERGVDGIITDDPALVASLLDELAALTVLERMLLSFQPLLLDDEAEEG